MLANPTIQNCNCTNIIVFNVLLLRFSVSPLLYPSDESHWCAFGIEAGGLLSQFRLLLLMWRLLYMSYVAVAVLMLESQVSSKDVRPPY